MAIPKMNSQELNNIFVNAKEEITSINDKIDNIKEDIAKKLKIMSHESKYINSKLSTIAIGAFNKDEAMKVFVRDCKGQFDYYGATVHPEIINNINIFNLNVGSNSIFFRNDVKLKINDSESDTYTSILKHDSLPDKKIFFEEFTDPNVTITIEADLKTPLGSTLFNMLEIDSFLPGSYDIEDVLVYNTDATGALMPTPTSLGKIERAGQERIILPAKVKFYKLELKVKINYSTDLNGKKIYPFGLKHMYFYETDFRQDSFTIATITSDNPIAIIKDDIKLVTPSGVKVTTITDEDIHVYIDNINDKLATEVYPSTADERKDIARNTNVLFVKIPLINRSIIGISFEVENRV